MNVQVPKRGDTIQWAVPVAMIDRSYGFCASRYKLVITQALKREGDTIQARYSILRAVLVAIYVIS